MHFPRVALLSLVLSLPACKVTTTEYKSPDTKPKPIVIRFPIDVKFELPKEFFTCDNNATIVNDEIKVNSISIEGTSDVQDHENTDCDGKKIMRPKMPAYNFTYDLTIVPPPSLKSAVTFAKIENTRTCTRRHLTVMSDKTAPANRLAWRANPYWIDDKGLIYIGLNNSTLNLQIGLNVARGQNLINIVYYGQCLEPSKDPANCEKAEELGRQTVLVTANIENKELNGIKPVNDCTKPKK